MNPDRKDIENAIQTLAEARHAGRSIVVLTGHGLSVESGVPTTEGLIRYLAALRCHVHERIYLPSSWRNDDNHLLADREKEYRRCLLEFIKDFGWPDAHGLTERLWQDHSRQEHWRLEAEIDHQLNLLAEEIYPERFAAMGDSADQTLARDRRWDTVAHWTDLVRHVTGFDRDYAASLFTSVTHLRRPGLGHRFLAFLARLCGIKLFLATNMDRLLQKALAAEGIGFRSYNLGEGRPFPSPILIRNEVTVLNIFGQENRPYVDEQHELPLDEQFFAGLRQFLPGGQNTLLLVVGASGKGRRGMDLIERGFLMGPDRRPINSSAIRGPAVVWLHYEDALPLPVRQLYLKDKEYGKLIVSAGVKSPGLFLRHLYFTLSSRYPASAEPYAALEERPRLLSQDPPVFIHDGQHGDVTQWSNADGSVVLFDSFPDDESGPNRPSSPSTASEQLAAWMNEQEGYVPIWIELAAQYTLAGVAGVVIDQCRHCDPTLSPAVLPLGELDPIQQPSLTTLQKVAERIREALQRGRYAVAIDGIEAFAWPQTTHHGTVSSREDSVPERIGNLLFSLFYVLRHLEATPLKGTRLGISINAPKTRHATQAPPRDLVELKKKLQKEKAKLKKRWKLSAKRICSPGQPDPPVKADSAIDCRSLSGLLADVVLDAKGAPFLGDTARLVLLILSCFRRTRTLVALRTLLGPLFKDAVVKGGEKLGPYNAVDGALNWYCKRKVLLAVEGGMYWMKRAIRDPIYDLNSRFTGTDEICKVFSHEGIGVTVYAALAQLILLALHHNRIARHYYFETYLQSKDSSAFFEYVYHRVSSIRYLTKAALVLKSPSTPRTAVKDVCTMLENVLKPLHPYLGISEDLWKGLINPDELGAKIADLRQRRIAALRTAWTACQESLSAQVPAEQLISWCSWLVENDLPRFRADYYIKRAPDNLKAAAESQDWKSLCWELDQDEPMAEAWRNLRDTLFAHWLRCCRERGDRPAIDKVCALYFEQKKEELMQYFAGQPHREDKRKQEIDEFHARLDALAKSPSPETSPKTVLENIEYLCESAKPKHAESVGKALGNQPYLSLLERVIDLAEIALPRVREEEMKQKQEEQDKEESEKPLSKLSDFVQQSRYRTLYARYCLLQADSYRHLLSYNEQRVLPWAKEDGTSNEEQEAYLGKLDFWVRRGLSEIQQTDYIRDYHQGPGSYFYYRTRFLLLRSRSGWLRAHDNRDSSIREEGFKQAYQDLELARGRLDPGTGRTLLAEIDLASAEAVLAQAGLEFDNKEVSIRAGSKLDIADSYLKRALDHLMHGRRNVIWWREYFRLRAQYDADRNLLRLHNLLKEIDRNGKPICPWEPLGFRERAGETLRQFVRTLRLGFQTVGIGRQLELGGEGRDLKLDGDAPPWTNTTLWELYFTAVWMGRAIWPWLHPDKREPADGKVLEQMDVYIENLAYRSGIKIRSDKPKEYEDIRQKVLDESVNPWDKNSRKNLLGLAREAAKAFRDQKSDEKAARAARQ